MKAVPSLHNNNYNSYHFLSVFYVLGRCFYVLSYKIFTDTLYGRYYYLYLTDRFFWSSGSWQFINGRAGIQYSKGQINFFFPPAESVWVLWQLFAPLFKDPFLYVWIPRCVLGVWGHLTCDLWKHRALFRITLHSICFWSLKVGVS